MVSITVMAFPEHWAIESFFLPVCNDQFTHYLPHLAEPAHVFCSISLKADASVVYFLRTTNRYEHTGTPQQTLFEHQIELHVRAGSREQEIPWSMILQSGNLLDRGP